MRLTGFLLMLLLAPCVYAGAVGVFTEVTGDVQIQRGDQYLAAATGVEVEDDDIIETGDRASSQVDMNDGSVLRIGENSRLLLDDYKMDDHSNVLTAGIDVLSGWLRFAVAKLRSPEDQYNIQAPTMTIGIRGTEGLIEAGNERGELHLEEGEVAVRAPGAGSMPVKAGQYIERAKGRPFARSDVVPQGFRSRIPAIMHARAARRAHLLRARGVPPHVIRRLERKDRERYLREHPHLRQRFERRFQSHTPPGANLHDQAGQRQPTRGRGQPSARPPLASPSTPQQKVRQGYKLQQQQGWEKNRLEQQHKREQLLKKKKKEKDRERSSGRSGAVTADPQPPHA
jgi:hypothetical protein